MTARGRNGRPGGSGNPRYAKGTARAKLRRRLRAEGRGCWICRAFGRPDAIDYSLPARHPRSFEVDDLVPVSKGGDPVSYANVDAAHRECNIWRSNRSVGEVLAIAKSHRARVRQIEIEGQASRENGGNCPTSREW